MNDKFLIIFFKSKSDLNFGFYADKIKEFSSFGYKFDKVEFVDYSASKEITAAVQSGTASYRNVVAVCPAAMGETLKIYVESLLKSSFDGENRLVCDACSLYLQFTDAQNPLSVGGICDDFNKKYGCEFSRSCLRLVGAPAAKVNEAMETARGICPEMEFRISEKHGDCTIEELYNSSVSKAQFDAAQRSVLSALNEYVYSLEEESLAERLVKLLKLRQLKFACAESFTGGGISKKITSVSGASEVFFEGLNTYSNEAKMSRLGVKEQTLDRYGAVSEEVCAQMAEGLLATGNCTLAVSTTGIAGPKSDNTNKPVGLAYIGVATKEITKVYKFNFKGSREDITETAINFALFLAFKALTK